VEAYTYLRGRDFLYHSSVISSSRAGCCKGVELDPEYTRLRVNADCDAFLYSLPRRCSTRRDSRDGSKALALDNNAEAHGTRVALSAARDTDEATLSSSEHQRSTRIR
jgi:hypothetical protein